MYSDITAAEAGKIRHSCRQHYREEGTTDSPYIIGTTQNLVWESEALAIMMEEMQSE